MAAAVARCMLIPIIALFSAAVYDVNVCWQSGERAAGCVSKFIVLVLA